MCAVHATRKIEEQIRTGCGEGAVRANVNPPNVNVARPATM